MSTRRATVATLLPADGGDPGCDAGADVIEAYVELELAGRDAAGVYPAVAAHQRSCAACRADHDGLLEAARRFG